MTTFAVALKQEIRRLARKEVKEQTAATVKSVARYRREIAALKRLVHAQERKLDILQKRDSASDKSPPASEANGSNRFSARSVRAQRQRVGLSAAQYAQLVGVSPLTIYNWEHGKSRPRNGQFEKLLAIRGIGKRGARERLEQAGAQTKQLRQKRGRRGAKR